MPRFPVETDTVEISDLAQGVSADGFWQTPNVPPNGGPALMFRWDITGVYLPIAVGAARGAMGTVQPTVCYLTVQLLISGELAWQTSANVPLVPFAPAAGWVASSATIAESLNNPIRYRNGQSFRLGYMVQLDQAVEFLGLVLAGQFLDPSDAAVATVPASVGYTEAYDPLMAHA